MCPDKDTRLTWIQQAINGDQTQRRIAFNHVVACYQEAAHRYAYYLLQDAQQAEDAVQEAFIVAYLRIGQLKSPEAFWSWLRRIIFTQCDRMIRGVQPRLEPIDVRYDLADDAPAPEDQLAEKELRYGIRRAIATLPEHERTVTESYYMQGQSQKEIANELEIPLTTVKKRLQYARQHLRVLFGNLNAAFDQALAEWLNPPTQEPQRQPVYVYSQQYDSDDDLA
jgi:RNA polymerase sigma factor (sigma-70 family)